MGGFQLMITNFKTPFYCHYINKLNFASTQPVRLMCNVQVPKQTKKKKKRFTKEFKSPFYNIQININLGNNFQLIKFSSLKSKLRTAAAAFLLYQEVIKNVNYQYFLDELQLSDSLLTRSLTMCVDVHHKSEFARPRWSVFEGFHGASSPGRRYQKHGKEEDPNLAEINVEEFLQGMKERFCEYDQTVGDHKALAILLWKRFYKEDIHSSYLHILMKLAKNIQRYAENLGPPTVALILNPKFLFIVLRWLIFCIFFH